jgi:hypothetical protein
MALDYICTFIFFSIIYVKGSFPYKLDWGNYPKIHFQLLFHSHLSLKIPFCNNFHQWCDYNEKDETKKNACGFSQKHDQLVGLALITIQAQYVKGCDQYIRFLSLLRCSSRSN